MSRPDWSHPVTITRRPLPCEPSANENGPRERGVIVVVRSVPRYRNVPSLLPVSADTTTAGADDASTALQVASRSRAAHAGTTWASKAESGCRRCPGHGRSDRTCPRRGLNSACGHSSVARAWLKPFRNFTKSRVAAFDWSSRALIGDRPGFVLNRDEDIQQTCLHSLRALVELLALFSGHLQHGLFLWPSSYKNGAPCRHKN